jgi:hypothetical protein
MEIPLAWGVGERFKSSKRKRGAISRLSRLVNHSYQNRVVQYKNEPCNDRGL